MRRLAFVLLLAGCADGSSVLTVTVDSKSQLSGIDHLAVDVTNPAGVHAELVTVAVPDGLIPPTVSFALRFPASVRGSAHLAVDAIAPGGASLARKETDTPIEPSQVKAITLTFGDDHSTLPPAKLAFTPQPMDAAFSYKMTPVQVTLEDAMDQPTTSTSLVTVKLGMNAANAHLGGTLSTAAVNGVATFSDLRIDGPGDFTLVASSSGLPDATSSVFHLGPPVFAQATSGIYGGAILALAAGGARIYAGADKSGVFTSTDGGSSWTPSSKGLPTHHVSFLAVDQTSSQIAFAATDVGIYKTTDGGANWSVSFADTPTPLPFSSLTIDPANHLHVYAGTYTRVMVTSNGGTSWTDDSTGLSTAGKPNNDQVGEVRSIWVDNVGATVYAATYHGQLVMQALSGGAWTNVNGPTDQYENCVFMDSARTLWVGADGGMWKHPNGGAWAKLTTGTPNYFKPASAGCVVQIDAMNYLAASHDTVTASGGVVYSSDGGISWNTPQQPSTDVPITSVLVDPSMPSRQFASTTRGVYKGSGGGGWVPTFGGLTALPITTLTAAAPGQLYAGTDNGGLWVTNDSGLNWGPASGSSGTLLPGFGARITALALAGAQTLYAGVNFANVASADGVWKSTDGAMTWTKLTNGIVSSDIDSIAIAPTDPMLLYAGYGNGVYKTINGGTLFTDGNLSSMGAIGALAIDPTISSTVYAGTGTVWKTTNGGGMWNMTGTGLPAMTTVNALAIDPTNPQVLFAATDGGLYVSTNGAGMWTAAGGATGKMLAVAVNPTEPNIVIASGPGGLYRSYDGGMTFAAMTAGLADLLVNALAFDKTDSARLWAGTAGAGVYKTP